jgi:hypothetical protein
MVYPIGGTSVLAGIIRDIVGDVSVDRRGRM